MNKYLREVTELPEANKHNVSGKWQKFINDFVASDMKIAEVDAHAMDATYRQVYNGCMMAIRRGNVKGVLARWRNGKVYLVKEDVE